MEWIGVEWKEWLAGWQAGRQACRNKDRGRVCIGV